MDKKRLEQLIELINSKWIWDRIKAAISHDLPLELQEILVKDEKTSVRYELAGNPSVTNRNLWELLRNDKHPWVRKITNKRIEEEKDKIKAEFKEKILKS